MASHIDKKRKTRLFRKYMNIPGKSCFVGALSWIFLSILKAKSVSPLFSRSVQIPASMETPSMSSDSSSIRNRSMGLAVMRDGEENGLGLPHQSEHKAIIGKVMLRKHELFLHMLLYIHLNELYVQFYSENMYTK